MLKTDPSDPRLRPAEAIEDELAAALPATEGPQFFPWIRRWALHVVPFILLAAAAYVLWREFRHVAFEDILAAMQGWSGRQVLTALGLSATSFILMGIVEWLGLVPQQVPVGLPPVPLAMVAAIAVAALPAVAAPVPPLLARSREATA